MNIVGIISTVYNLIQNRKKIANEYAFFIHDEHMEDYLYAHIGGLYMIDDDTNTVYHCDDFYNEKRDHFICKNHNINFFSPSILNDFFHNRNYLSLSQDIISTCQNKKFKYFILRPSNAYNNSLRRLEMNNYINNKYEQNYKTNKDRKLNNIEDIQETIILFKEIEFKPNKFEFCFKYESKEQLKNNDLILIINPKNNNFFGEICLFQDMTWLINNEYDFINCYFINNKNPLTLKIDLKKQITSEKELYIYIKGKVSGTIELYDLTKNKTLNISSTYYIPYINNFPPEKSLNFILPKHELKTYINIIINDYGFVENKTIGSIFEIYEEQNKIKYENNNLILEKDKEYYFKYYPNQNELIINFIPIYSNKFLEKQFYIINEQNIFINYNIESISNNQSFGLFLEFNGIINDIKGYFSNTIKRQDNIDDYILNNNNITKYFILTKNDQFSYFNLDINVESGFVSELIIHDINEVVIINKIDSVYEIKKTKIYMFTLDENLQKHYSKFESFTIISINNSNNIIKLLSLDGYITSSKNYLITELYDIKRIFIKVNKDDIFMIKLISEEVSKYINEESGTYYSNTFLDDKKYSIDFIHNNEEIYIFYNSISPNIKYYEINSGNYFQFDDFENYNMNYSFLFGLRTLEKQKTLMILKESASPFLYEKYINNLMIDLNYILDISKICYLLMDFEYHFSYNRKIKKLLLQILNDGNKYEPIYFICKNDIFEINNTVQILNVEKCNGTFVMSGNNSLIYFYLPLTVNDSYNIIEDKDNFELSNINEFFFVPKKNDFNSINILLTMENKFSEYPIYLIYNIEYGIIPYSRNIDKNEIFTRNEANIIIPNFSNCSKEHEKYFIFFKFNTTVSKINVKVKYEKIIYLDDQTYLILKPGINIIKFRRDIDHYLNITKFSKNTNTEYSMYKNEILVEKYKINETNNIIYVEEPSYNENIKIKIENEDDILLRVSSEKFLDFSMILYNKNIDVEQIENILKIKFNTTNYDSKLEYQLALIDEEYNIEPISIHKKFYENNIIYKNIIYSKGIEPIETNITLKNDNFTYDKNYTLIAFGKDSYRGKLNYFYMEPKTLFISSFNNQNKNTDSNTIEQSIITDVENESNSKIIQDSTNNARNSDVEDSIDKSKDSITNVVDDIDTDNGDDYIDYIPINDEKKSKEKKIVIAIVCLVIGAIIIIVGLLIGLIYCKKKKNNLSNNCNPNDDKKDYNTTDQIN